MKQFLVALFGLLFFVLSSQPADAEITSISSAINKAGRQRMLTQRMVKAYTMLGLNIQTDIARHQLNDAILLFDNQLSELRAYTDDSEIQHSLDKVDTLWRPFKAKLLLPVERAKAIELNETADELLRASHKVVLQFEDRAGNVYGRLVNTAGRQRMLSQRIAKLYMLRSWEFDNAEIRSSMGQAKNEFNGALYELLSAKENTPQLLDELEQVENEWKLMKHGLERKGESLVPLIVSLTSEKMLTHMNQITQSYEKLSATEK